MCKKQHLPTSGNWLHFITLKIMVRKEYIAASELKAQQHLFHTGRIRITFAIMWKTLLLLFMMLTPAFAFAQYDNTASISGQIFCKDANMSKGRFYLILTGPYTTWNKYGAHNRHTQADSTGHYQFSGLRSGTYYLIVQSEWDYCFPSKYNTDTLELKDGMQLQHDHIINNSAKDSTWIPDRGLGRIHFRFTDSLTGKPVRGVSITLFEYLPERKNTSINTRTIYEYDATTDSTGSFITRRLCHGTYGVNYYYYMDGKRELLGRDKFFLSPDDTLQFQRKIIVPKSVRPTKTLLVGNVNAHFGNVTTGELAIGVGHVIADYKLNTEWETMQAGCEFNFDASHFVIGPKLTYNYSRTVLLVGVDVGGSLTYYTDFSSGNVFLHPHAGFCILTILDVYAGYNIPLSKAAINESVSRFTLTVGIPITNRKRLQL